jgi:DNA-binding response OmpR family regulator
LGRSCLDVDSTLGLGRQADPVTSAGSYPRREQADTDSGTVLTKPRPHPPRRSESPGAGGPHILVVDDDADIRLLLTRYLELDGFRSSQAPDATAAVEAVKNERPDLVLLDVMMPGRDGLDLLRELRSHGDLPVIMVTARGDEADRVMGLRLGADDYIVKPFSSAELVARIAAVLRRLSSQPEKLEFDGLTLDITERRLIVNGHVVQATHKEFDLLAFLAASPSHVFTREQLLENVWGSSSEWQDPATVTEHVRRIRHLVEVDPDGPSRIRTVRGVGYSFEP